MEQQQDGTEATERISAEQLQALDADEKAGVLFYLTGFLRKSLEFQDALTLGYQAQMRSRDRVIPDEAVGGESKFADWERCEKRHGSQAAHLLDCDESAVLRNRQPSRGGLIGNGPAMVRMWTSGELVSFAGPNGPWQRIASASELKEWSNK